MSYINCKKCNHLFDLDLISPFCPKCNTNNGTKDSEPKVVSVKHDDDTHSHYALIDSEGRKLWSENPEECAAQGYPVYDPHFPSKSIFDITDEDALAVVEIIIPRRMKPTKRVVRRRSHLVEVAIMGGTKFEIWIGINTVNAEIYESSGLGRNSVSNLPRVYKFLSDKGYNLNKPIK